MTFDALASLFIIPAAIVAPFVAIGVTVRAAARGAHQDEAVITGLGIGALVVLVAAAWVVAIPLALFIWLLNALYHWARKRRSTR
jgi:hypothetical protein